MRGNLGAHLRPHLGRARTAAAKLVGRAAARVNEMRWSGNIPRDEVAQLLFGQQHVTTQDYFAERVGSSHTVPLPQIPHARFAAALDDASAADYMNYLEVSWKYYGLENTPASREKRLERFREQIELIRREGAISQRVRVFQRPDGRRVIADGNHRAAIALALGLDLPAVTVPVPVALRSIVDVPHEFYGSRNRNLPYQSLHYGDELIVAGRRKDMLRRIKMLEPDDMRGSTVLDLGCNVGSNCFLAVHAGAASAHGLELSPRIATAAVRLNCYYAAPCWFTVHDLTVPFIPQAPYDVVFCFSVVAHLPTKDAIVETFRASTGRVAYFEGHENSSLADYRYILNEDLFSSVDLIGYGQASIHGSSLNRPLFRCEV
jgi:hypothetical protein